MPGSIARTPSVARAALRSAVAVRALAAPEPAATLGAAAFAAAAKPLGGAGDLAP